MRYLMTWVRRAVGSHPVRHPTPAIDGARERATAVEEADLVLLEHDAAVVLFHHGVLAVVIIVATSMVTFAADAVLGEVLGGCA